MKTIFIIAIVYVFCFDAIEKICPFGSAQVLENDDFCKQGLYFLMTPDIEELTGGVYGKKADFSKDFTITYKYKQNTKNMWNIPADGIALTFYKNHYGFNRRGGGLGYIHNIDKGITFELDIFINKEINELTYHTAIHLNGSDMPIIPQKNIILKEDYLITVQWLQSLSKFYFYLDKKLMHEYEYKDFNNENISWAITAATGGLYSEQCMCLQDYP